MSPRCCATDYAPDASFDHAAKWLYDGMAAAFKSGAARLAIAGANPELLSNEDPDKVGRANRAVSQAYRPALELITRHEINWTIVAGATPAWAAAMFPNDAPDAALPSCGRRSSPPRASTRLIL